MVGCPQLIADKLHIFGLRIVDRSYAVFLKNGPKLCKDCSIAVVSEKRKNRSAAEKQQILDKRKWTNLERYGTEFASQNPNVPQKAVDTFREKYGVDWILASKDIRKKAQNTYTVNHLKPVATLEPVESTVLDYRCAVENTIQFTSPASDVEIEVFDYLRSLNEYTEIDRGHCSWIEPLTVSLYLPNYKLAIDCESTSQILEFKNKPSYHLHKSKECGNNGIFPFSHLWV